MATQEELQQLANNAGKLNSVAWILAKEGRGDSGVRKIESMLKTVVGHTWNEITLDVSKVHSQELLASTPEAERLAIILVTMIKELTGWIDHQLTLISQEAVLIGRTRTDVV